MGLNPIERKNITEASRILYECYARACSSSSDIIEFSEWSINFMDFQPKNNIDDKNKR